VRKGLRPCVVGGGGGLIGALYIKALAVDLVLLEWHDSQLRFHVEADRAAAVDLLARDVIFFAASAREIGP